MPTAAYTTWLAQNVADRVVLAELQPAEVLSTWTATGGHANVYQTTWNQYTQSSVVPAGVYRRLDAVRQDATLLASQTSLANLDAAGSGYYSDSAASVIYVKTTSGASPTTFAAMMALFTIFVATSPIDFVGGNLYEPRLTGELPTVQLSADDPLFGVKVYSDGRLALANADKFFDALTRAWVWKNKLVTIKFGGASLAYADFETIAVMRVEDAAPSDHQFTLTLRAMASLLEKQLPLNTISASDYPSAGDGVAGTYKPLLYGAVANIPGPGILVDKTSGNNVYLVADPAATVLTAVSAVRAINKTTGAVTTLTLTTHYTVNLAACTVTVTSATYDAGSYDIRIDATGKTDGAGSYFKTCGQIAKDILLLLGESSANINASAFSQADTDDTDELAIWIREQKSAGEYVRIIEQSVLGAVYVGRDGLWRMDVWSPLYDAAALPSLVDEDFASWEVDDKLENIFWKARVQYLFNPATGAFKEATDQDAAIQYSYDTTDVVTIETRLVDASAATRVAQRYRLLGGSPTVNAVIEERGLTQMTAQPFDKVLVTRARAPHPTGAYNAYAFELLSITKSLTPPKVTAVIGDLRGFGSRVGKWAATAAADYPNGGAVGYWSDSGGSIDGTNATLNLSIWY